MQNHPHADPYEREPLDSSSRNMYDSRFHGNRGNHNHEYDDSDSPYYDSSPHRHNASYPREQEHHYAPSEASYPSRSGAYGNHPQNDYDGPVPPPHTDTSYFHGSRGQDGMTTSPYGNNVIDNASGRTQALHSAGQVPPPPSRAQQPYSSPEPYLPQTAGGYGYDQGYDSTPNLAAPGPAASRGGSRSPSRSPHSYASGDVYNDDPYQGLSTTARGVDHNLGVVNPLEIDDDGDDGLNYSKRSQRNSMLSSSNSDRGARSGLAASAAVGGAAGSGNGMSGALGSSGLRNGGGYYDPPAPEKTSAWSTTHREEEKIRSKKKKWAIIILAVVVVVGAIVGGIVGSFAGGKSGDKEGDRKGQSAKDDQRENGDLDKSSNEIKELMNNPNLHKVFPGMDYTPFNTQYPYCIHDPPSQNNVTRDVAVLSQLTNKIRLYGTDCNQTQMVIEAIRRLDLENTVKIWMGVWQDKNTTTNERQLQQMWDILDEYGQKHFEGIIVANEILFREEMSLTTLGSLLDGVRANLTDKSLDLHVATSDLGDDWTPDLAASSDYIMANIHPFFAGVDSTEAASWTMGFWETNNKPMWKKEKARNVISETGWPSDGGKKCPEDAKSCTGGAVAGIDEMNQFMNDWVCQALKNGTEYFWFEAFDEPWKVRYNVKGKEWEDKWGLMDLERNLKNGIKIPDCGGMTVDNAKSSD